MSEVLVNEIKGEVRISQEVVSRIATIAAKEVDGVESVYNNLKNDWAKKLHIKSQVNGVNVEVVEKEVKIALALNIKYNYSIPEVTDKVQEKIKSAIESMTDLTVLEVNIVVAGISSN